MKPKKTSIVHLKLRIQDDLVEDLDLRAGNVEKLIKLIQRTRLADILAVCEGVRVVPETNGKNEKVEVIAV